MRRSQSGFSLVELAVVLAVIGLLVGGTIAGGSLIRSAKLQSLISDITQIRSAANQFKTQYNALPGDMVNATSYWGIAAGSTGNDSACQAQATTDGKTCNGDGNRRIGPTAGGVDERYRFWQHLTNANLFPGNYTGVALTTPVVGTNLPGSKFDPSGYFMTRYANPISGDSGFFDRPTAGNSLFFGAWVSGNWTGILTPAEAFRVDSKMDDGKPGTGSIGTQWQGFGQSALPCSKATSGSDIGASYNLPDKGQDCILYIWQAY
jgi:prepilin-type N-terminal cleavage/methylation domain-containing protein